MMFKRRRAIQILLVVAVFYAVGLVWGYQRLPLAVISDLDNGEFLRRNPSANWSRATTRISTVQESYLERRLAHSQQHAMPRAYVSIQWNAFALARVQGGYDAGFDSVERKDRLYLCLFGGWVCVHAFSHIMS